MTGSPDDKKAALWLLYVAADLLTAGKDEESAAAAELTARFLRGERGAHMLPEARSLLDAFDSLTAGRGPQAAMRRRQQPAGAPR